MAYSLNRSPDDEVDPARDEHDRVLAQLVAWYEESDNTTQGAREKSERDRDYYDGKQWTEEEAQKLRKRGQPVIALNVIRTRINYQLGLEKKQRRDPKAVPRGPSDQEGAEVATDALRYAVDRAQYHDARSRVWENIKIEGAGALECTMKPRPDGNQDVAWRVIPWDRFFADPHSSLPDYSDARYLGQVRWMDEAEVLEEYGEGAGAAVEISLSQTHAGFGSTYEDKPKSQLWADARRKRVRVVQMYYLEARAWKWCEFTRGGILAAGDSPYIDDRGESLCGIVAESCYIDRNNNRYGEARDLIDPQDEVNKRRSKSLHLLNSKTVRARAGAVANKEEARRELARPDGWIETQGDPDTVMRVDQNTDLAMGQTHLLQQAMAHIMASGPNAALLGKGTEDQSGVAIGRQQQGGLIELGDGLDTLRRLDWRVFRMTWFAIKRYWSAPMWIRVTENEQAPRFVGINQVAGFDPMTGQPHMQNAVAEMDVDISLEDAPDVSSLEGENFTALMEIFKAGLPPPVLKLAIELHPALAPTKKKRALALIQEMEQMMQQGQQAQVQAAQAKMQSEEKARQVDAGVKVGKLKLDQQRLELEALRAGAELARADDDADAREREMQGAA